MVIDAREAQVLEGKVLDPLQRGVGRELAARPPRERAELRRVHAGSASGAASGFPPPRSGAALDHVISTGARAVAASRGV